MRIGLDFDNTIVCYDKAIEILADEIFDLPEELPRTKLGLRDFLRANGRESDWTSFQGELYGPGMQYARLFRGVVDTMQKLVSEGNELVIISHRSRWPYAGHPHDLHAAARAWVADNLQVSGLFGPKGNEDFVYFLETKHQKLAMITHLDCDAFVDDLPDVLHAPEFPAKAQRILFDPGDKCKAFEEGGLSRINCWLQLPMKLGSR